MPSAGEVSSGVVKRRNSMITEGISPALPASTEATHPQIPSSQTPLTDYAIALRSPARRVTPFPCAAYMTGGVALFAHSTTGSPPTSGKAARSSLGLRRDDRVVEVLCFRCSMACWRGSRRQHGQDDGADQAPACRSSFSLSTRRSLTGSPTELIISIATRKHIEAPSHSAPRVAGSDHDNETDHCDGVGNLDARRPDG